MLIAKNKSLADFNYKREPTYNDLRKVLEDVHKEAIEIKQNLIEKQTKLNKLKPKMTPDTLRGLLQVAAQDSEEKSEEIARNFLAKEKTYEEFINEFIKKRTEYHIRRIKYEKLIDSLQNPNNPQNSLNNNPLIHSSSSSTNLHHQTNYPPTSLSQSTNQLPYPMNNISQPLFSNGAPFAYQPFNTAAQPIRSAPLPPHHMMELPPYQTPFPITGSNSYTPQSTNNNQQSYPFNINPNFR